MKKILSIILSAIIVFTLSASVFAIETVEKTITLSDFIDVKKEQATSVQIYIYGNNYEIDIDKFFEIADECIITPSSNPQPITKDGMYIGIISNGVVSSVYISNEGGIDNAVPASGRQLNAVYTMDTVSYVDRIIELLPEISLSTLTMFDKETVEKVKLYSPRTGTEAGFDGEASIEGFFNTANNILLKINSNPYEISKNGLYMTVCDKNGNEGYFYITESGEMDYYSIYDSYRKTENPKATYITENIDEIKVFFDRVRPRTYATNATQAEEEITFKNLTGLSRDEIDHIVIRDIVDDVECSIVYDTVISDIYNAINSKEFFGYSKNGPFVGSYEIIFFDKNNLSYSYTLGIGLINDDGLFMLSGEEDLKNVVASACELVANECSDWAKDSVSKAKEKHILENDKNYNYTQPITREGFCELVFNFICVGNRGLHTDDREVKFVDTDNHKVHALNRADIIYGKSETEFAPNDLLTREEAATILVRMINREMPMEITEMWFEFDDINDISEWASDSVQTMCNLEFMIGVGENKFAPKDTYTVEQAIVTLMRIYEATRKTYNYETPLGVIQTEENYNSHINFAIQCDAKVELIQDKMNFDETHYVIEKPVKALTDQTSNMLISFDDFAEMFEGKWKLNEGLFEFTYDTSSDVKLEKFEKYEGGIDREWPNKTEAVNVITFYPDMSIIRVNGNDMEIKAQYGGKVYNSAITMYKGKLYIPVQMVAELLKFDIAALQAIY